MTLFGAGERIIRFFSQTTRWRADLQNVGDLCYYVCIR